MKYDVFISYSSHDQKIVEGLCAYLEQHKIRCFVAYRDIPRGVVWARAIVDALDESRMMLVVFSEHFNNSDQVDREIELASEDKKPILTFRISDETFKGAKKYYLKNLNWIDAFPNPEKVFGCVAENVASLLGVQLSHTTTQTVRTTSKQEVETVHSVKTYKVGDYYDDGKKQGVVFEVCDNGQHGKIVSLDQKQLRWCESDRWYKLDRKSIGVTSKSDGQSNTDIVMSRSDYNNYPAFAWCREQGEDWYLPSQNELLSLYHVKNQINKVLLDRCKEMLNGICYWSSTEHEFCAWAVYMYDGNTRYNLKYFDFYVRAVSAF